MLTIHHLERSQSERIVWLCEELGISYDLRRYARDVRTMAAPPEFKALHPLGAAPVITDGKIELAESAAIVDYLLAKEGRGRLVATAGDPNFADYLYWFHFVNGTLQPMFGRNLILERALAEDNPLLLAMQDRLRRALMMVDQRLTTTPYLAGEELTAADIMMVFSLTTMRYFTPFDLAPFPGIRAYLQRIGARPAYRAAMAKGDPDMVPLLT